jgi:hypothetical protein
MRFSMNTTARRYWRLLVEKPLITTGIFALVLVTCSTSIAHADATLTYELSGPDGEKMVKEFSTSKFFVRIDDPSTPDQHLLFQAGRFFPLYSVDTAKRSYIRLTGEVIPFTGPESRKHRGADETGANQDPSQTAVQTAQNAKKPAASLKPTKTKRKVAGIECRVVHEVADGAPVIEHCMANSARLGLTKREIITMARTFEMARNRDLGWLGVGTEDEEFVSVYSRDQRDNRVLQLTEVSNAPLPVDYHSIPREYQQVKTKEQAATDKSEGSEEH